MLNLRNNNNFNLNESNRSNIDDCMSKTIKAKEKGGNKTIENSFNILEVIITQFLKCCISKNMRIKMIQMKKQMNYYSKKWMLLLI